jgi:hypothetical protein
MNMPRLEMAAIAASVIAMFGCLECSAQETRQFASIHWQWGDENYIPVRSVGEVTEIIAIPDEPLPGNIGAVLFSRESGSQVWSGVGWLTNNTVDVFAYLSVQWGMMPADLDAVAAYFYGEPTVLGSGAPIAYAVGVLEDNPLAPIIAAMDRVQAYNTVEALSLSPNGSAVHLVVDYLPGLSMGEESRNFVLTAMAEATELGTMVGGSESASHAIARGSLASVLNATCQEPCDIVPGHPRGLPNPWSPVSPWD